MRIVNVVMLIGILFFAGCGGHAPTEKELYEKSTGQKMKDVVPLGGTILVDGKPELGVFVTLNTLDGSPVTEIPVPYTNKDGKYLFSMYRQGGGALPGEYKVTFEWCKVKKGGKGGPDKLNGRYNDPLKSEFKLTLAPGKPQSSLNFELKTSD